MKINEYQEVSPVNPTDILILDRPGVGTRSFKASELMASFENMLSSLSPLTRKKLYRGSYLGTSITSTQLTQIRNGTFNDLFIGDYWTIQGYNWHIADFDYFCKSSTDGHHIILVPDKSLFTANPFLNTNTYLSNSLGLGNSKPYQLIATGDVRTVISRCFSSNVLKNFTMYLSAGYNSDGETTNFVSRSMNAWLMNETMLFGKPLLDASYRKGHTNEAPAITYMATKGRFSLFDLNPAMRKGNCVRNYALDGVLDFMYEFPLQYDINNDAVTGLEEPSMYSLDIRPFVIIG